MIWKIGRNPSEIVNMKNMEEKLVENLEEKQVEL